MATLNLAPVIPGGLVLSAQAVAIGVGNDVVATRLTSGQAAPLAGVPAVGLCTAMPLGTVRLSW
mgnify:CR=1 FL=1